MNNNNTNSGNTMDTKNIFDFKGLKISLASPEMIKGWSKGEVIKPETINYRTLRPEKDGLFSEWIFGPTKDWECYCGKYKRIRYKGIICDKCGVEVTQSRVRRERMGHITLAAPCAHVWFSKGAPSVLSLILDITPRSLEQIIYFAQYLITEVDNDGKLAAEKKLEEALGEKIKEIKAATDKKVAEMEEDAKKGEEELRQKVSGKEQLSLAVEEYRLRSKQKIQNYLDEQILEENRAKELYKNLVDKVKSLKFLSLLGEEEYYKLDEYGIADFFKMGMGAEVVLDVLEKLDLNQLAADLREESATSSGQRHLKAIKRLRVIESLKKSQTKPAWMILKILPVIPPDLRPMVQLVGGRFATSDLNDLYRRVINRNNRLKHLMDLGAPEIILRNEKRMLQEAVDALIDSNQKVERRRRTAQALRSLSDMLRGKQGRFRRNLLGKRVDYSGRSVVVVGPELKLNECGIPKEMALELFKPYVLREMIIRGYAPNVRSAKNMVDRRPPEVFDILEEITKNHPVLLNRAPTLHKLGIQAFYPILIEGNAIRLHPCVCSGFNADFDGDQMAVHVVLSEKAQQEAIELMLPEKNLLKPSDGSPITVPNKEMAVGIYYLTSIKQDSVVGDRIYSDTEEAIFSYQTKHVDLRELIKVKLDKDIIETTVGRIIFNSVLPKSLGFVNETIKAGGIKTLITKALQVCPDEVVVLIDAIKTLGFDIATTSAISVSVFDCEIVPQKKEMMVVAEEKVSQIDKNYREGLITLGEKKRLEREVWMEITESLADLTWDNLKGDSSVRILVESGGTRASRDQIKQLAAMRGLVVDPTGRIVDMPTKSNFREGLTAFEYVTSARGSRKGLTDTAIKTSDAGYLTRRLADVAHDAIIREDDCGTTGFLVLEKKGPREKIFFNRILGRILAEDLLIPGTKKILLKKGELITEENIGILEENKIEKASVRSPLHCKTKYGLCVNCYGLDLSNKKLVEKGTPSGVLAAQSIGEPGTQLTLRTKHAGGVVGLDVTQGLPRVEELLEIRIPKTLSPISEISGKVKIEETDEGYQIQVKTVGVKPPEEREYIIPLLSTLMVEDGGLIAAGDQLASGSLDVKKVLEVKGLTAAQEYLIAEVQFVYESQGIPIHDKHFEVIVKKMSEKVRIATPGDTALLPGELVSKNRLEEENAKILAEGGEPATAQIVILGITRSAINTESWLSAASFQETTNVLTEAAISGKEDKLLGLKENVIIGRLIPTSPERADLSKI